MSIGLIFIQIIGIIAWLFILMGYRQKNTDMILAFHIVAVAFFAVHYLLLEAYSGFIICIFELIRDYLYYKTDKDKYIFLYSLLFYIMASFFIYDGILTLFPLFASLIDGFFLTKHKKVAVAGAIIVYIIWFIYDLFVKSYSGMFADIIVVISNLLILIFNYNIFDKKSSEPVIVKR